MKGKKNAWVFIVLSLMFASILACSTGSAATPTIDPTMAALQSQLTQMSQQLTDAAPGGSTPSTTNWVSGLIPGDLYLAIDTITPTATTHWEIAPVEVVVGLFSRTYINEATSLCLDSNAQGDAYTLACNGGNFQKWSGNGKALVNVETGLCLDSNASGQVYTLACNGGSFQNWTASGKTLINVATGLCLDSNASGQLYTMGCNGGGYQNWN